MCSALLEFPICLQDHLCIMPMNCVSFNESYQHDLRNSYNIKLQTKERKHCWPSHLPRNSEGTEISARLKIQPSEKTNLWLHVYWMAYSVFWFICCLSLLSNSRKPQGAMISVNLFYCALRIGSGLIQHRLCTDHQKSTEENWKLEGRRGKPSEEEPAGNYPPKDFPIKDSMVKE